MAITTLDGLVAALGGSGVQTAVINKASIATQATSGYSSLWRGTGTPAQGAIPSTAAVIDKTLSGALINFTNAAGGQSVYLAHAAILNATNSSMTFELHDRLAHMGGLSGVTTGNQTVSVDVSGTGSNMAARRGASGYVDVQWWAEIYTDIGTTGQTCTVTYTNAAGTPSQTTTFTLGGASPANQDSRIFPIIGNGGEFIQSIQTVSIGTSTGTAGSWGITATRKLAVISAPLLNVTTVADWAQLGLPKIENDACLFGISLCGTTTTGNWLGQFRFITG
jgi:hypothetical protein